MTQYFEVHERDGAARAGELRLAEPFRTPALVDEVLEDAGSRWSEDRALPAGDSGGDDLAADADSPAGTDDALTILPHRGFPAGTDPEVQSSFQPEYPAVAFPSAAVVHQDTASALGQDAYVLSSAQGIVGHAAAFVEGVVETREAIEPDAALYLPGVATPGNVATLAYAGVDLLDADRAVIRGTQGWYLTPAGETRLSDLDDELPCPCPACQQPVGEFDREDCVEHNVARLRAELSRVRAKIRAGRLRDYLEGQARHEQWHTAAFRRLDQQWGHLEQRTPLVRRTEITAASEDTLRRVEIQRYADRVTSRYRPRFDSHPLVLVPCSASKPYSDSQSHRQFHDAIDFRGHVVSITSPIGVVPAELELTYPAQHYDSVVTGEWSETELAFVARVLAAYLERADYPRIVAHVPEDYRPIVERALAELDADSEDADAADVPPVEYTVEDHPTTETSLGNLRDALDGELRYSKGQRYRAIVQGIADYMLGDGAGDAIFEDVTVHGRYPKLQVDPAGSSRGEDAGEDQLAAVVPTYGTLAFTLAGAKRWVESDAPVKRVEIDEFVPHGSALAPGVVDADEAIRPGDEVIVEGPLAFGVGRAAMSGPEMRVSTRGVAVDVRHVEER